MTSPQALVVRTFSDRAEGLPHFVLRAGEAPRLLAFDDVQCCPVENALAESRSPIGLYTPKPPGLAMLCVPYSKTGVPDPVCIAT